MNTGLYVIVVVPTANSPFDGDDSEFSASLIETAMSHRVYFGLT